MDLGYYNITKNLDLLDKAFNYHYWSSNQKEFQNSVSRWKNEQVRLDNVKQKILVDDQYWDRLLTNYAQQEGIPNIRGCESGGIGNYSYQRDLSGLKIANLTLTKVLHSIHYTRLEYCLFEKCYFTGKSYGRIGEQFFFSNHLSHSRFNNCIFRFADFWNGEYKNIMFYDCEFYDVIFNVNSDGIYENILFMNCDFKNIKIRTHNINSFKSIGQQFIKVFMDWDTESWNERRKIQSITYRGEEKIINYFSQGEKLRGKSKKFRSLKNCYLGLLLFYETLLEQYDRCRYFDTVPKIHFLLNWIKDQLTIYEGSSFCKKTNIFISRYVLGYGDRPERTLIAWSIQVIAFSVLYLFSGIVYIDNVIHREFTFSANELSSTIRDWSYCLYYSVITSATVGYGDIRPMGISMLFASIQSIIGMLLFTMFTVVFARRFFK